MLSQRVMSLIGSHLEGVDNDDRWVDGDIDSDELNAIIKFTVERKVLSPAFTGDREYPPHGERSAFILDSVDVEFFDDNDDYDHKKTLRVLYELKQYIGFMI